MELHTIYRLISPSGKSYIGQTHCQFDSRWGGHLYHFNKWKAREKRTAHKLYNAFNKYDPSLWERKILQVVETQKEADELEKKFIMEFDTLDNGYNCQAGGKIRGGSYHLSEEHKAAIAASKRGKKRAPFSEQARKNMSAGSKGKPKPWRADRPLSEEHRSKISASQRGKKKKTLSQGRKPFSPEGKARIAAATAKRWAEKRAVNNDR